MSIRVIAAVETQNVLEYPKNLIVELKINDGPKGEVSDYVLRSRGIDNFYAAGEFFFHANDARVFHVEFGLHPDSQIDLLVHNVDVHDVLAECAKSAGKTDSLNVPTRRAGVQLARRARNEAEACARGEMVGGLRPGRRRAARDRAARGVPRQDGRGTAEDLARSAATTRSGTTVCR